MLTSAMVQPCTAAGYVSMMWSTKPQRFGQPAGLGSWKGTIDGDANIDLCPYAINRQVRTVGLIAREVAAMKAGDGRDPIGIRGRGGERRSAPVQ